LQPVDHRRLPHVHVVTIPGSVFFLPIEVPERVAQLISEAVAHAHR